MHTFIKDQMIYRADVAYRVVRPLNDAEVQLEELSTGKFVNEKALDLLAEYARGELLTVAERRHSLTTAVGAPKRERMDSLSEAARYETRRRVDYLLKLDESGAFNSSRKELRRCIAQVAKLRGEARPPHETTVYRWRRKFLAAKRDIRALTARFDRQGGKGSGRLQIEVEAIIHEKIESVWMAKRACSAEELHQAVFLAIQRANTTRIESEWLKVPGLRTIQRRLFHLYGFEVAVARYGQREAERRYGMHLGARRVSRILEIVEIDHTPVDLLVTDESRVVIGRPTITVLLDRRSRCCLGYCLSLAGHGLPTVFAAIRHAMLPKVYLKARYADLKLEWPCHGWMEVLLADNGREFHANALGDAMANLGVTVEFAKSRDPNDKPHVERFLKTFNYSFIHRLPGTTLAKAHQRIGFKAEEDAAITLEELDRMIHVWICSEYHLRPHAGLEGRAPIEVWREDARAFPPQLKANKFDLDIEFAELCTSKVQHYGIELNTFVYVSPALLTLRRMLPESASVTVKWPRDDVGHIWVWDPINEEYLRVQNKEEEYHGLTLEQAKAARRAKSKGDPSYQQTRAEARDIVNDLVKVALEDKKLKTRRQGARLANKKSDRMRGETEAVAEVGLGDDMSVTLLDSEMADVDGSLPNFVVEE